MKHTTSVLLALFGLAAAAPAQFRLDGILGRHIQVGVQLGSGRNHCEPVPVVVADVHGGNRGRGYRGDRGHDNRGRGHWETVCEQVQIPGYWHDDYVPARYGWVRDHCGRVVWDIVEPACNRRVWVPPRCETRTRKVWVRC